MGRLLLPFQHLAEKLTQAWMSLSERERRLVSLLGLALVISVIAIGVGSARKNLAHRQGAIENKIVLLQEISALSGNFREAEAARSRIESRLRGAPVRLFSYLEDIAKRQKVAIGDMQDRGSETKDDVVKSTVELSFARIALKPLVEFLNEIEKSPRVVKIEKLRVRHRNDDPELLDVNLTVSTYHLAES